LSRELTLTDAIDGSLLYSWIMHANMSKVAPKGHGDVDIEHYPSSWPNLKNSNIMSTVKKSPERRNGLIEDARKLLAHHNIQNMMGEGATADFTADRDQVLKLKSFLSSKFGTEGAKRFSEQVFMAFTADEENSNQSENGAMRRFWARFRTFLDVERAVSIGHPFRVDHFHGIIHVINDANGLRIEHAGNGIGANSSRQMTRNERSNF